jgi:hypothetical protein
MKLTLKLFLQKYKKDLSSYIIIVETIRPFPFCFKSIKIKLLPKESNSLKLSPDIENLLRTIP